MKGLVLLLSLALAVLLVGCGSDNSSTSTSASSTTPATPAEAPGTAPSRPASQADSGGGAGQFVTEGADNSIQEIGEEASDAEREEAAEVLHTYLDARAARKWATACSFVSTNLKGSLQQLAGGPGKSCGKGLAAISERVPDQALADLAVANVGSLRVDGSRAFILYHGARGTDYAMPMTIEDGSWKVSALEGSALL